jgi:hypothetical protein
LDQAVVVAERSQLAAPELVWLQKFLPEDLVRRRMHLLRVFYQLLCHALIVHA